MFARRLAALRPIDGSWLAAAANTKGGVIAYPSSPLKSRQQSQNFSTAKQYAPLPKLPVPDPRTTLNHFLEFAKPLQTQQEFQDTEAVVKKFAENELPTLQKLLEERASKLNNWPICKPRTPLPIVTSPGLMFPVLPTSGKDTQIDHAAQITQAAVDLAKKFIKDMAGKTPFDMSQYKFMYGTTRIPRKECDEIFSMPVLNAAGQPLSLSALSGLFNDVIKQSRERQPHAIGIVSSDKRDRWAEIYEQLEGNPTNSSHLSTIEDALFVCLHGGGTMSNSCNRWFDKTLQFVIGANGACGLTYEHTPAEGPPVAAMMDFICDKLLGKEFNDDSSIAEGRVKRLDFELNDAQIAQIKKSGKKMDRAADDVDVAVFSYKRYGKNYPKSVNISPDSFIQMAFQLAFFRIHSALPPTYETATLRKFDEGRTENIRSPNTLAEKFIRKVRLP
ncbi:Choline/Carnitine O-acyltransferase [Ostertagia ostertagi]